MSELKRVTMAEVAGILAKAGVIVESPEGVGGAQKPVSTTGNGGAAPSRDAEGTTKGHMVRHLGGPGYAIGWWPDESEPITPAILPRDTDA